VPQGRRPLQLLQFMWGKDRPQLPGQGPVAAAASSAAAPGPAAPPADFTVAMIAAGNAPYRSLSISNKRAYAARRG
jgi:hypothetical protein